MKGVLFILFKMLRDGGRFNIIYIMLSGRRCNEMWFIVKFFRFC